MVNVSELKKNMKTIMCTAVFMASYLVISVLLTS